MLTIRSRAVSGPLLRLALVTGYILALYILYLVAVRVSPAEAVFNLVQIDEVMAGAHGNPDIQFVEMRMCCGGQNNQGNNAKLVFFNSSGDQMGEFFFPRNPNGGTNVSFLIATQAFADLFTTPAPDFIMPPFVQPGSGKVCYRNVPDPPITFFPNICLSYGNFISDTVSDTEGGGLPAPALPMVGADSLKRLTQLNHFQTESCQLPEPPANCPHNADFALSTPEPTNSLGETGAVSLPQTGDLIVTKAADPDPVRVETSLTEVGWEKWTPKSDKLERRRCQDEEGPARKVYQGIPAGSSEAGIGRESVIARGRASVVLTAIDVRVLGEAI